jgi:hypothetical protein
MASFWGDDTGDDKCDIEALRVGDIFDGRIHVIGDLAVGLAYLEREGLVVKPPYSRVHIGNRLYK